ncbi:alpha-1,4-glucan:maltose-1-phosphate maltosyltransferase [Luteibacter rhizovicinus]|uniref:Alpha-1,4-glucan:maltose-1-phosphate maltosyltransferase n=1 Tax=Luteibacter rhizovicinus TaxID=242606 RepID=A0A4R3YXM5_9GAMM|nr:maltotransferase domain-containing protein [Luteibacter rhizovicinus]TCV97316.1 alpha-1,4-glucan:maltose-1-phosphate maltosyltransferase [Luteibacter rhizovicinus]
MSASTERPPFRIYYLHPLLVGGLANWTAWLDHAAALGFRQLLIAPPFDASTSGDVFVTRDFDRLHPTLTVEGHAAQRLDQLAKACRARDMALWLDLPLDELASDSPVRNEHPEWFRAVAAEHGTPDPRWTPAESDSARWRLNDPAVADAAIAWWVERLKAWSDVGIRGYRVIHPHRLSATRWKTLFDAVRTDAPDTVFVAWTPGSTPDELAALAGAGFDATVSSSSWWDFRAPWFAQEAARLDVVAPALACPEVPFATRLGDAIGEENQRERAYHRAIDFSVASPAGWMMPMGFEYAVHDALDPRRGEPTTPASMAANGSVDLSGVVRKANAVLDANAMRMPYRNIGSEGHVAVLLSTSELDPRRAEQARLVLVNASLDRDAIVRAAHALTGAASHFGPYATADGRKVFDGGEDIVLAPGEVVALSAGRATPIQRKLSAAQAKESIKAATGASRLCIEAVSPSVDDGRFPAKRIAGQRIDVSADVFMDGHDVLAVRLQWRAQDDKSWHEEVMTAQGNDVYTASFTPTRTGRFEYRIEAWRDAFASYRYELDTKQRAGVPVSLELEEGRLLVEARAASTNGARARAVRSLLASLNKAGESERLELLLSEETLADMSASDPRPFAIASAPTLIVDVDRREAEFASWYELFPRSQTSDASRHGTFNDVIGRLPAIRDMGFDVLYFPPIHPIGMAFRKGKNNTLTPGPDDPGSPYAIGSPEGGHTAIHAQLGSIEDFRRLRDAAYEHGLELALDFAIQCSPDHPWLKEHPEWFDWRPDGSIRYAENPPKKYQDIVNVDFYADGAVPSLWNALCDVVLYWAGEGVRTFRVDNPHTKPFPFWEWMIARVRSKYPDTLFLSEAFTRPKPMYRLAKVGFSQSYTYFTWRNTKQEFIDYLTELTQTAPKDFFRPNFFVNTPDIDPYFLQTSGRPGFLIRAALATTLSGLWGVYSGFELCEGTPIPGKEEYLDSEKYEIKPRDWTMPGNIIAEITQLNLIRRAHPALQSHLGIRFLTAHNDRVLFFEKRARDSDDIVLVAISLDPHNAQGADIELPLADWGLGSDAVVTVQDLLHDHPITWRGAYQNVWLGLGQPYALWHVRLPGV